MRNTYAEQMGSMVADGYSATPAAIQFLSLIFDAVTAKARVKVAVFENANHNLAGEVVEGTARHVVDANSDAFTNEWNQDARLRVTTVQGFEAFIPLRDIEAIALD